VRSSRVPGQKQTSAAHNKNSKPGTKVYKNSKPGTKVSK